MWLLVVVSVSTCCGKYAQSEASTFVTPYETKVECLEAAKQSHRGWPGNGFCIKVLDFAEIESMERE